MTAVKPVLDAYLDLNVVLALSALIWLAARAALRPTVQRHNFIVQLRVLKALCLCVLLSPVLALTVTALSAQM